MGQAKLRGTKEQRDAEAIADIERYRAERKRIADERDAEQERIRAAKWDAMTQEERDAAWKRAQAEAENYGYLAGVFGHDVAGMLLTMGKKD